MAELIYSTKEVYTTYLKDRKYKIPEYQRGYKWNEKQICQLILDINSFETDDKEDLFYCLQNITLYPSVADKNILHVVDGQQRLTTTYLLFCYLGMQDYLEDKFIYAVRESSNVFMQKIQNESKEFILSILQSENFDSFCSDFEALDFDHQDIYYMYSAICTIDKTIKEHHINLDRFREKFVQNVKFIVNEIHSNIKEQELFMNLNTGKVPLDGADLVRAIIITRVAKEEMISFNQDSIKDIVRMNEKRTRIGWELDQLNQWWSSKDVKNFYKPFAKLELDSQETIEFNEDINPINILYKLWASTKADVLKLKLFENTSISALVLYKELIILHRTLVDWFSDRAIYHYLGYLANNQRNFNFKKYYDLWNENESNRESFKTQLRKDIEKIVFRSENKGEPGFSYWSEQILNYEGENKTNWYESNRLEEFLVLLDVIEISSNENYRFLSPNHFKKNKEDKEHIYPCTPKNIKELENSTNDFQAIEQYLIKLDKRDLFPYQEKEWKKKSDLEKEEILKELESKIHQLTPINAIGNLVLLHYSINRGFGNDYYIDKRASVINNVQNGEYVRQHTLNLFVKGRTEVINLNEWTFKDVENNCKSIEESLRVFFGIKKEEYEEPAA
ncbi:DUF262 domain-containing protein [Moheibacter stercoris]|uniref:Uncharacterized protein with ParB-like and HNH nuclease domain n=1 Tax=Moheibacter stercoris TaxID=1628251 RepID=A0ABV2LY72_9FLAO